MAHTPTEQTSKFTRAIQEFSCGNSPRVEEASSESESGTMNDIVGKLKNDVRNTCVQQKISRRAVQAQYSSKGKQAVLPDETESDTGNASNPTSHDASSDDKHGCRIWGQSWGASGTPDHV